MASEPLRTMPAQHYLGDSLRLQVDAPAEYPVAEWSAGLHLAGPVALQVDMLVLESGWLFSLPAEDDDLVAGWYAWALHVRSIEEPVERHTLATGKLEIVAIPQTTTPPSEQRSFARRALEVIEAAILRQGSATLSFSVFGRTYTFQSHTELLNYRNRLRSEVDAEDDAARVARGEPSRKVAWVRFTRP